MSFTIMSQDVTRIWMYALDAFMLVSIPLYSVVLIIIVRRPLFSASFTAITISTGVADILFGLVQRLTFLFPQRNWFRCALSRSA